ncbi:phytanoyl-CoA dioxygenase family protein [Nocardia gipuzkoensis]
METDQISPQTLSPQQRRHYDVFGYVIIRGWFDDIIEQLTAEFELLISDDQHCTLHDGTSRSMRTQFIDSSPFLAKLLDDPRVDSAFTTAVGSDWQYFGSVGNLYAGDTGWHVDNFSKHRRAKLALYLDPTGPGRGGLSVVPLSQNVCRRHNDLHMAVGTSRYSLGLSGDQIPSITLTTSPGDALLFNHNLLHSAWGGSGRRRMLSINAHAWYQEDGERLHRDARLLARFLQDEPYGPYVLENATDARRAHLQQLLGCAQIIRDAVTIRRQQGTGHPTDDLPDLTDNPDEGVALAEFVRDNDYEIVSEG